MIYKPTVIILGAGASMMYGFPSGKELKDLVIRLYNKEGSALDKHREAMGIQKNQVKSFCEALSQSGVSSVDAFLEHRKEFLMIGKTAIAEVLIPFEDESKLFTKDGDWYGYFLDKLNSPLDQFHENMVTIITFNYDRSLEWYLYKALHARFGLKEERVIELISKIPVIHLYGTLGGLPCENNGRFYNPSKERQEIYLARDNIKIIHENNSEFEEFKKAREILRAAYRIVFLGFGHNKVNVMRLKPDSWRRTNQVLQSSGFGLTDLEKKGINRLFDREIDFGKSEWDILKFLRERVDLEER